MVPSLRFFLAGILDYAGLFPPARLPLDQAIRNHARYRHAPESWMLGRFICPAARLPELAPLAAELFAEGPPLCLSVLGRGGDSRAELQHGLREDLQMIEAFHRAQGGVGIEVFEVKASGDTTAGAIAEAAGTLRSAGLTAFFEISPRNLEVVVQALAAGPDRAAGVKLRCGGMEPAAFPNPALVASTIVACRDAGVPLKATAGLHHPLRRLDPALGIHAHGFLNVFGAGILAHARLLDEAVVRAILEDEAAADFTFDAGGFHWRGLTATPEEIRVARATAAISFGSCSFDEPRDDLRAMGLLP